MSDGSPPRGATWLFDRVAPPLLAGDYRLRIETPASGLPGGAQIAAHERYFSVAGPRFEMSPDEVAGVFPPRAGSGAYANRLAHVLLRRRTLPWERALDPHKLIPDPDPEGPPPVAGPTPWLALLVLADTEYALREDVPLRDALPRKAQPTDPDDVWERLGRPEGSCDVIELQWGLLQAILPRKDEVALLTHVRQVNVDDRELQVAGGDGFFAAVSANRLPTPGASHRACLVSLEERSDLLNPPAEEQPQVGRLVLLHSWTFLCEETGDFHDLMAGLTDVKLLGEPAGRGRPPVAEEGHVPIAVRDRSGAAESAWYRGPLVKLDVPRLTGPPVHSAEQALRPMPGTDEQDISYAAAFEAGRLLAAANGRLAQELMRWRRDAFAEVGRREVAAATLPGLPQAEALHGPAAAAERRAPLGLALAAAALHTAHARATPLADPWTGTAPRLPTARDDQSRRPAPAEADGSTAARLRRRRRAISGGSGS